jgi:hypothetical protein
MFWQNQHPIVIFADVFGILVPGTGIPYKHYNKNTAPTGVVFLSLIMYKPEFPASLFYQSAE